MRYEIKGDNLPIVICKLNPGETLVSESGAMGWMSDNIKMDTNMKGGLLGGISRTISGESIFLNTFTCKKDMGMVAFPSSFPGKIIERHLLSGESIICQKKSFLAAESSVKLSIFLKKKLSTGLFGGEGFILQKITGPGIVFLEFDGHVEDYSLLNNDILKVDTGHVAMFDSTVSFDISMVKGVKNMLFGGEGLFLGTLKGPGKVYLQTMPIENLAAKIGQFYNFKDNK
ncbi:hypothetical protein AGR56_17260 [Clostridium sp. DMHC 10]|uniref:TIGR00266 family protein n=1 Tax=Clostridium sp. DMHC 10 TaxID=747377 RepID=UPI00069D8A58|nr:TIGR00266 family protein [Clostridium sp. DMHC 10]KOF55618.1 hypothetical protein AGR56_17260 [Clostridium sp. DMHC 10]